MHFVRVRLSLVAVATGLALGQVSASAASVENGKAEFIKNGCWQCHDFEGQGSTSTSGGRVIANTELPLEAFEAYVRDPSGAMPPFHKEILSDSALADIYAYLEARPKPQPVKDIPLLNSLRPHDQTAPSNASTK